MAEPAALEATRVVDLLVQTHDRRKVVQLELNNEYKLCYNTFISSSIFEMIYMCTSLGASGNCHTQVVSIISC